MPAPMTTKSKDATNPGNRSDVSVSRVADHGVTLDQFLDAEIERVHLLESGCFDLGVGNDVIALIRVLAHRCLQENKLRQVFLNGLTQLLLGNVGVRQAD